jgi:DNA-directed RNA polymerase sigma subunit (sigma70/sigma32)
VRQLERGALFKLRHAGKAAALRSYTSE